MCRYADVVALFLIITSNVWRKNFYVTSTPLDENQIANCAHQANLPQVNIDNYKSLALGYTYDENTACFMLCLEKQQNRANDDGTRRHMFKNVTKDSEVTRVGNSLIDLCNNLHPCNDPCMMYYLVKRCLIGRIFHIAPLLLGIYEAIS